MYIKDYFLMALMRDSCVSIDEWFLFSHVKYFSWIPVISEHHHFSFVLESIYGREIKRENSAVWSHFLYSAWYFNFKNKLQKWYSEQNYIKKVNFQSISLFKKCYIFLLFINFIELFYKITSAVSAVTELFSSLL